MSAPSATTPQPLLAVDTSQHTNILNEQLQRQHFLAFERKAYFLEAMEKAEEKLLNAEAEAAKFSCFWPRVGRLWQNIISGWWKRLMKRPILITNCVWQYCPKWSHRYLHMVRIHGNANSRLHGDNRICAKGLPSTTGITRKHVLGVW